MKFKPQDRIFHVAAAWGAVWGLAAVALTGCVSPSLEDAAPTAAQAAAPGPIVTGEYPNLNVPPASAATPISDAEKAALTRDLAATRSRVNAGPSAANAENEAERLRRLARTHAQQRLEELEKGE
ncbi:hypothetical protein [Nitratireductor sp. ZSWI3]|uniref:hypothetical protein n=1 Tax=Nitratireductor sp. ZSWI3 TaxID=2966359 RepID=UPI00214FE53B|nr:hypothetical protein [Nitratireductor sp. ZSWI3]MCR4267548.1 hypothetical protein [Nitratireductor sp. ZSWI3]